jgi:GNAT superfamily N-acetyltransferase
VEFVIEEIHDLRGAWPEIEPLLEGIMEYHRPWEKRTPMPGWTNRLYEIMDTIENVTFLARDESRRAVGFLNGAVHKDQGIFREPFAFVNNAFVVEQARSHGVATALLRSFEVWARAAGAEDIRLNVSAGNELGLSFWAKSGFDTHEYIMRKPIAEPTK